MHRRASCGCRISRRCSVPDDGITKGDLIEYYRAIAPYLVPYLVDRPTVLTRYPDGIAGEMFYQKDMPDWTPPWLRTTTRWSEHSQREIHYVLIDDADGLAYVANLGSIPIHCWASRIVDLERPDWTIVDLDPEERAARARRATRARDPRAVRRREAAELRQDVGPDRIARADPARRPVHVRTGAHARVSDRSPRRAQASRHGDDRAQPDARDGRVYLDWGQNAHGQLLVAPYSVRPMAGAPVSMPLVWDEVVPELDARQWNIKNALDRVASWPRDPCLPVLTERPDLAAALGRLEQHARES